MRKVSAEAAKIVVCQAAHLCQLQNLQHLFESSVRLAQSSEMVSFPALNKAEGLKAVDEHLLTRSYITG